MINNYKIEICCGCLSDCLIANNYDIDRIELNSALELGGLTPSISTFLKAKKYTTKKIVCMVRTRTAGFLYNKEDIETMFSDAKIFLDNNADGIVFGFLNKDNTIDKINTQKMVKLIHSYNKEAIFHRAFDEVKDPIKAIETLIECDIDRVLTSGLMPSAYDGIETIKLLEEKYKDKIEILPGCGINSSNINEILEKTHVSQFHMSAKKTNYDNGEYVSVDGNNIAKVIDAILSQ